MVVCVRGLWWRVCVVCGEAWHALSLSCSLSFHFSLIFLFSSFSFSLFFFFFLCSCSYSFSCSFSCSCRHGFWLRRCRLMSSLPLLFRSCSMKTSLANDFAVVRLENERGTFLIQEYFRRRIYFYYSFKLIPKTRRRGKLQTLQFYINSKTIGLQRVKSVIIFAGMVSFFEREASLLPSFLTICARMFSTVVILCLLYLHFDLQSALLPKFLRTLHSTIWSQMHLDHGGTSEKRKETNDQRFKNLVSSGSKRSPHALTCRTRCQALQNPYPQSFS